jgi:hypothetical protein
MPSRRSVLTMFAAAAGMTVTGAVATACSPVEAGCNVHIGLRGEDVRLSRLTKPWFWLLTCLLAWLVLVVVQIALGMGGTPGGGGAP